MLHQLKFANNWNKKLDNQIFTTIRKANHPIKMGDQVDIFLQGKYIKRVFCIAHGNVPFMELTLAQLAVDTGYWGDQAIKIYENFGVKVNDPNEIVTVLFLKQMNGNHVQIIRQQTTQASLF